MTNIKAIFEGANWWLRDVASSTNFANVNNNGNCNNNNASNSNGVRPDFGCPLLSGGLTRKERLSLGNLNNSGEKAGVMREDLPYALRYDKVIAGV